MPVEITTGISDGSYTEVLSGPCRKEQEVILEAMGSNSKGGATSGTQTPPGFKEAVKMKQAANSRGQRHLLNP